ncbi:hypothetical protein GF374_01950 [Candidatus Woesearchaeota archaeon]|nr:hypothetical protein [Candidatus Woesearchaeota archaeon]
MSQRKILIKVFLILYLEVKQVGISKPKQDIKQASLWKPDECPACGSKKLSNNYFTGEIYCLKCGLVIY